MRFASPVFVTAPQDDATRLFVVEQAGRIRVFPMSASATSSQVTTFLDLSARVRSGAGDDPDAQWRGRARQG